MSLRNRNNKAANIRIAKAIANMFAWNKPYGFLSEIKEI
jgi:hypothetical protein